jgi:hypothetical protein
MLRVVRAVVTPRAYSRVFGPQEAETWKELQDAYATGANRWQIFLIGMGLRWHVTKAAVLLLVDSVRRAGKVAGFLRRLAGS